MEVRSRELHCTSKRAMFKRMQVHLRGRGLDVLPAFGQVLSDVTERTHTHLPPDVCCVFFFSQKHLPQGLNFILHLYERKTQNGLISRDTSEQMLLNIFAFFFFTVCLRLIAPKNSCVTFKSSIRRLSMSSSVRSEGEHPFSVVLVEKLMGDEAPPKPSKEAQANKQNIRLIQILDR